MVHTFACTIGQFINDDWEIIEHVVDFKQLEDKEHGGLYGGITLVNSIKECGGLDKISPIFLDILTHFYLPSLCLIITS